MKKILALSTIAFSMFFFACEDEIIPIPLPPQPAASVQPEEEAAAQAPDEKPSEQPAQAAKAPAKTNVYSTQSDNTEQLSTGRYVIQVAVFPIEASARKLIKKLADNGIKAYSAMVQDPDPAKGLVGTYYRVRIGYFDAKSSAETFAQAKLEPIGYEWWVDRKKYDNIGSSGVPEQKPFVVERIPEPAQEPKQMSEQEKKDAERAAAIAAAKEEYKAIAKAATASSNTVPPPTIPPKTSKTTSKK